MTDDVSELHGWLAMSHHALADRKPEELFPDDSARQYRRLHEKLYHRIVRLHGTICTLEQLSEFPFESLYGPYDMEFWRLVVDNFLDMACLMLHGLVKDTGPDVHSIPSFKNEIMRWTWRDDRLREALTETLRDRKFSSQVDEIAKRVEAIRHHRIAHVLIDRASGDYSQSLAGVSLEELRLLFNDSHLLFGALCFGSAYATLAGDLIPSTVGGVTTRTCLDKVLDAVIRDACFVNQPERDDWWRDIRKHKSEEELRIMNELRKRVGLPEA